MVVSALASAVLFLFAIVPLMILIGRSFWGDGGLSLEPLRLAWADNETWKATLNTLMVATGTSAMTVTLGVPTAWLLARSDVPNASGLRTALAMPYAIPPYVMAIGWITLLNPRSGLLNTFIAGLTGAEAGPINIYSTWGMIFVLSLSYYPLVMLQTYAALMGLDPSLEEAARTSGAPPWRVVRDVTLPLVTPAIASGALLTFLIGMASFGVPYLVGQPGRVKVLTTAIYNAIDVGTDEHLARAVALAVLLGIVAASALLLNRYLVGRGKALQGGKAGRPNLVALGPWRTPATVFLWGLVVVALGVPLLLLLGTSMMTAWGRGFASDNISLANYAQVFGDRRTLSAIGTSLGLAAAAATICVLIGTIASYMRTRTSLPGRRVIPFLAELPYAIPGTVLAMGFILAFSQEVWIILGDTIYIKILLFNTAWILLAAYCVKYLAFGVRTSDAALTQIDVSLEEAARTSGASPLGVLTEIVAPLLRPALVAAWVLVFLPALGEITMSILLFGPKTRTLGVLLFDYQTYESPPKAAVLASLLAVTVLTGNLLVKKLTGGRFGI